MHSQAAYLLALAASGVAADKLSLYLGEGCRNANLGTYEPVELGSCIDFGQAQSYILTKNEGDVYNLYSGGGCGQYEGQVSLSGACLALGEGITGLINIGNQDSKRKMIRGATREPLSTSISTRGEGDTYQCPNVPSGADYFFVVETSSATEEDIGGGDEQTMRNDFMAQFNTAYQNPSGQTQVSSFTPYDGENFEDVQITLDMTSGVIQDFQDRDMESMMNDLMIFRDQQRSPVNFFVSIYSGRIDNVGGILARLSFRGD